MVIPTETGTSDDAYLWTLVESPETANGMALVCKSASNGSVGTTIATGSNTTARFKYSNDTKDYGLSVSTGTDQRGVKTIKFQTAQVTGGNYLNHAGDGQNNYINEYGSGGTYNFSFIINATLNDTEMGYALGSFSAPYNTVIPENVEVYTAKKQDNNLLLTRCEGTILPANTAVILKSETAGSYEFEPTTNAADINITENVLKGTSYDKELLPSAGAYVLGQINSETGMYSYTGTAIPAYRAYLPKGTTETQKVQALIFGGTTTSINNIEDKNGLSDEAIYDLSGRKVSKPVKGIYIKGGKKIIVK